MKARKYLALLLAVVMSLAIFSSCGSNNNNSSSPPTTSGDGTGAANSPAPSQGSAGGTSPAPSQGSAAAPGSPAGEVVFYTECTFEESWWDPALFMGLNDANLAPMIYENLVELNTDNTIGPQLAESWKISDDGLTYTFNLRKGVQWHKGYGEFTSADVKFTLERQTDPAVASVNADNLNIANIKSIDCPDDYTVVINLQNPDVDLLYRLAMYYGIIVCKAHSDKDGVASINTDPIGTGPFAFDSGTLGVRTEVVRNRDWWGNFTGNIDRVVSTYISDTNTIYTAFDSGELDAIGLYDRDKMREYESKGYQVQTVPILQLLYIGVNMKIPPFDDPKVREAFFYAVDVQYYLDNLFYGMEVPAGSYVPPSCKYALKDYFKFDYNLDKAKQLLADAGYPNGCPITMWSASDALGQPPAIIAQDQLTKAGFKIDMQNVEFGVFIDQVRAGTAAMWVLYNDSSPIGDNTIIRYTSDNYPGNNWCGVTDAEYDGYVAAGMKATTEQEKFDNFYAAQKRLMDLQVVFPVATNSMAEVWQQNVTGVQSYGDTGFRLQTVTKG